MRNYVDVYNVPNGSVIGFDASACIFMKVTDSNHENAGVVRLVNGQFMPYSSLNRNGYGTECYVIADTLDKYLIEDEED